MKSTADLDDRSAATAPLYVDVSMACWAKARWSGCIPWRKDIWTITTRRSMDASAPGEWTLRVHREGDTITGLTFGCWLARKITLSPTSAKPPRMR
ncbi:MAG: hypothetical protein V9G14_04910 [Cypionkella sp.]